MHGKKVVLICLFFLFFSYSQAQKVGLVLSGGGARGLAHIGVLKALEENKIPIDYITGTSIGAMVGGMYAAGYSPWQIEQAIYSNGFEDASKGIIEDRYKYFFKKKDDNASWISLKFSHDSIWQTSLPLNVINPIPIDFALMEFLSSANAVSNYNFDSLMIPFRCVAADIESKKQIIFKTGNLGKAIRASFAFPFYFSPVMYDDKMLFDGGLYNNFPADAMNSEFNADIIIGSNVSGNNPKPDEDNFISQLKTMVVNNTDYKINPEKGILIEPKIENIGLFEFEESRYIVEEGYKAAMKNMEGIKALIKVRVDSNELSLKRKRFVQKESPLLIDKININGLNDKQAYYVRKTINPRSKPLTWEKFKRNYFRLTTDDNIKRLFPTLKYNPTTGYYDLELDIRRQKALITQFGGNFSSRPISEAFVGLQYNFWGAKSLSIMANAYFGKLYNSGQFKTRLDFPTAFPFYIESDITLNQWDFYSSSSTFLEDIKPSYLIQTDSKYAINFGIPAGNRGKLVVGSSLAFIENDYYQIKTFLKTDTSDLTKFSAGTAYISYERNTLNKKLYANEGTYLNLRGRLITGEELTIPGSTSLIKDRVRKNHSWYQVNFTYQNYYKRRGRLKLGLYTEGVFSQQPFFANYSSSILSAPAFEPLVDSKTFFIESFRAYTYFGGGTVNVININDNYDIRLEGYIFQPYKEIIRTLENKAANGVAFEKRYFLGSTSFVYHSPIGPVSISINYYDQQKNPISVLFHFGYILFNKKALE